MALRLRRGTDSERQQITPDNGELIYTTDTKLVYVGDSVTVGGVPVSVGAGDLDIQQDTSPSLGGDLNLNNFSIIGTGSIGYTGSLSVSGTSSSSTVSTNNISSNQSSSIQVTSELSLASVDITGAGNINLDGSISANNIGGISSNSLLLISNLDLNGNNIIGQGNINIDGTITATGDITLGDNTNDTINITGQVNSNIIPTISDLYNIGSLSARWSQGYFVGVNTDTLFTDQVVTGAIDVNGLTNEITTPTLLVDFIQSTDGSEVYNSTTSTITAANINATGFVGDLVGSVFGDDSSVFFDAIDNSMSVDSASISSISSPSGYLQIGQDIPTSLEIQIDNSQAILTGKILAGNESFIELNTSNGTFDAQTVVSPGDVLSGILLNGYDGSEYVRSIAIAGQVDPTGAVNAGHVPGQLVFLVENSSGTGDVTATFNSHGIFTAPVLQTGEFADVTARNNQTGAGAGSIVFVADNGAGKAEFQGYDGTDWVPLSSATAKTVEEHNSAYTVAASDLGHVVVLRTGAGTAITLPDAANFPLGFYVDIVNMTGNELGLSKSAASNTLVISTGSNSTVPLDSGATIRAMTLSDNEWLITK